MGGGRSLLGENIFIFAEEVQHTVPAGGGEGGGVVSVAFRQHPAKTVRRVAAVIQSSLLQRMVVAYLALEENTNSIHTNLHPTTYRIKHGVQLPCKNSIRV